MRGIVSQSNYFPWRGYWASMREVDRCVLFDSQQFTRRDWRNRNLILGNPDPVWLTLALKNKGNFSSSINQMEVQDRSWGASHLSKLRATYREYVRKPGFVFVEELFESFGSLSKLSEINLNSMVRIFKYLEIDTSVCFDSGNYKIEEKNAKLIEACTREGISHYFSGPAASSYLDIPKFQAAHIDVSIFNYEKLPDVEKSIELSIIHWLILSSRSEAIRLTTFET